MISTGFTRSVFVDDVPRLPVRVLRTSKARGTKGRLYIFGVVLTQGGKDATVRVEVEYTACTFGGARPWWRCPCCASRRGLLYVWGMTVACRRCLRLVYRSQWRRSRSRLRAQLC